MSIINVAEHNETIYDILYQPPPPRPKSPMYVSEKEKALKRQKKPKTHANMGFSEVPLKPPECYLKKGEGIQPPRAPVVPCVTHPCIPPIPKQTKVKKEEQKVNFRVENIKKVVKATPKLPIELKLVDTPRGHRRNLLETKFKSVYRKTFGILPKYLVKQNWEIQKAEEQHRYQLESQEPLCKPISPEEREELLDGLKKNWADAQKAFLLLPMLTDTIPKVIRKQKLENHLKQLEKDIKVIEANPFIYVYD